MAENEKQKPQFVPLMRAGGVYDPKVPIAEALDVAREYAKWFEAQKKKKERKKTMSIQHAVSTQESANKEFDSAYANAFGTAPSTTTKEEVVFMIVARQALEQARKKAKLGTGKRFDIVTKEARMSGAENPEAVAGAAMWKKYGKKGGTQLIKKGLMR